MLAGHGPRPTKDEFLASTIAVAQTVAKTAFIHLATGDWQLATY